MEIALELKNSNWLSMLLKSKVRVACEAVRIAKNSVKKINSLHEEQR